VAERTPECTPADHQNSPAGFSASFVVILVFAFEDIWELGDIRLTAPSGRLVAMTNIAAQIE